MWHSRTNRDRNRAVCIACDDTALRSVAREYDKEGSCWERRGEQFEHPCKSCYRGLYHQPCEELESPLGNIEGRGISDEGFLLRYLDAAKERHEPPGGRGR